MADDTTSTEEAVNKPMVYKDPDGTVVYRASALGQCPRTLLAARLGMTPLATPDSQQARFDDGHMHEEAVIKRLTSEGWELSRFQETVELPVSDGLIVRGHIDFVGRNLSAIPMARVGDERVWDVKSMSAGSYKKWLQSRFDNPGYMGNYAIQMSVYMTALQLPGGIIAKNKDSGELDFFTFDDLPYDLSQVTTKLLMTEINAAGNDPMISACDKSSYPCPYYYLHDSEVEESVSTADFDEFTRERLQVLADKYHTGHGYASRGAAMKEEAKKEILSIIGTQPTAVTIPNYTIKNSATSSRSCAYDKLRKLDPGIYAEVVKETKSVRFTLEATEKKEDSQ